MIKRALDLVLGAALAVLALPLVVLLAIVTAAALRSSPFFVQERVGRDGVTFRMVKLRTLPPSTPRYADKYAISPVAAPAVCRWLRACHLDELPQLFLVPLGIMSLVGPRPEMSFMHERMPASFAQARIAVRPGCTGLWQIGADCDRLIHESPEYDLCYLRGQTLGLDLWILWRTVRWVLHVGGPVTVDAVPVRLLRGRLRAHGTLADELAA